MGNGAIYRPTVLEVNLAAIEHNIERIKSHLPKQVEVMAIVKANGYGHGAIPIAERALKAGATRLGVAMLDDALELRAAGIRAPILVMGYTPPYGLEIARQQNVTCTIFAEDQVDEAITVLGFQQEESSSIQPLSIHLKVETGMNRIGFTDIASILRASQKIMATSALHLEGIFTHFASAGEEDSSYTIQQKERFNDILSELKQHQVSPKVIHVDNSAGAIHYPQWGYSAVRYGIALYGLYPSTYSKQSATIELMPVLSLKSTIVHLKEVPSGTAISYCGTYVTERTAIIATIPIGYADGYDRGLSNCGEVLVRGQRARVVGTICMDQLMIDVTPISDVSIGDEVVLIGTQGQDQISADDVAAWIGTINYEVVARLANRLHRKYIE